MFWESSSELSNNGKECDFFFVKTMKPCIDSRFHPLLTVKTLQSPRYETEKEFDFDLKVKKFGKRELSKISELSLIIRRRNKWKRETKILSFYIFFSVLLFVNLLEKIIWK